MPKCQACQRTEVIKPVDPALVYQWRLQTSRPVYVCQRCQLGIGLQGRLNRDSGHKWLKRQLRRQWWQRQKRVWYGCAVAVYFALVRGTVVRAARKEEQCQK